MARGLNVPRIVRERALDMWASETGLSGVDVANALGLRYGTLCTLVSRARQAGDARAINRVRGRPRGSRNRPARPRAEKATSTRALHLWSTTPGMSASEISAAAGMTHSAFTTLLARARKAGDPRAVYRDGKPVRKPREPGAPSTRRTPAFKRGPYRTRSVARALRDDILTSWSEGLDGETCAARHGVAADYVHTIVRRARESDDPRAVGRRGMNRFTGCSVTLQVAVTALARIGVEADDTAIIVGVTRARVREVLTHARTI